MNKKVLIILLVFLLAISSVACGSGQVSTKEQDSTITGEENERLELSNEKIKIVIMTTEFVNAPKSGDQLSYTELAKRTGVEIEFQEFPSSQYSEKVNLVISSGEYPDVMKTNLNTIAKYADDGIFTQLNDLYEKYGQNVLKEFQKDPNLIKDLKDDKGRMWFIPRIDWCKLHMSMVVNDMLLKQANREMPTSIDEFYDTLVAFKALGDDIIPWGAGQWTGMFQHIYNAFGTSEGSLAYEDKYYAYAPYQLQEKTKACLKFIAKCYKEKLIDQEYYSLSDDDKAPKLLSGKVGFANFWEDHTVFGPGKRYGTEHNYLFMNALKGPFGDQIHDHRHPISDIFVIPSASKYAARIIQMYDFMATDDGKTIMNWGVEGDTFITENGVRKYTDKIMKHEVGPINGRRNFGLDPIGMFYIMDVDSWAESVDIETVEQIKAKEPYLKKVYPYLTPTTEESIRLSEIMTDVNTLRSEMFQKFIVGELDIDQEWDNMIKKMEAMGIQEAIEIYNAMFERWKNR